MTSSVSTDDGAGEDRDEVRPGNVVHPRSKLAGPEGHPFHPILVTIPIGAWVSSLVFDVAGRISNDSPTFGRGGMWLLLIGAAGAALAAVFGLLDMLTIPRDTAARATAMAHLLLNFLATGVFLSEALIRYNGVHFPFVTPWWAFAFTGFGLVCIGASGYLGGRLAYHFGVRVGGRSMQAEGFVPTDGHAGHVKI